jgi:arylsulfatase A-like enzyme
MVSRRAFLAACASAAFAAPSRPSILLLVVDDLGYRDLGFQGAADAKSPHIDALAKSGIRCTNAYVSHPFCSPTRAGMLTGRYQQRFGHENNPVYNPDDQQSGLPTDQITIAQTLQAAGYRTGHIGKWHLGAAPKFHPLKRGFDESYGFLGGGHQYFAAQMEGRAVEYLIPLERNGKPEKFEGYLTDRLSDEAAAFIRRRDGKQPWFLYVAYNAPHAPQQAQDPYLSRFSTVSDDKRKKLDAMVAAVDDGVGRILATLKERKMDRDTLVFFLSDNGGPIGINGSDNTPLRGAKGQVYEGGIRVPFVVRWPGHLKPGVYRQPIISLDIFATAVAAAGGKPAALDSVDLLPFLSGKSKGSPHQHLFWRTGGGVLWAVREGRHKLVRRRGEAPELYDLETDIAESKDLAAAQPEIVQRLETALNAWNRELIPPVFAGPAQNPSRKK